MGIHHEERTFDEGMIREDYVSRVRTLLDQREQEMLDLAKDEYDALVGHGLALQISNKVWEQPRWVEKQWVKSLEQLIAAEEKDVEGFFSGKELNESEDGEDESPVVRTPQEEKEIKKLMSEFKKKTDKVVREYARIERPANLQKEQLAWRLYLTTKPGDLIQNDVIFDHFDYHFGDYFDTAIGAEAIQRVLSEFDLEAAAAELRETIATTKGSKQTQAIKRLKVVNSFLKSGTPPTSMVLDVLPVLPPEIRPMVQLDGGRFATSDLNDLYRRVINRNNRLKRFV
jgi:DNA-directed RNA polymerase, beta'' subunit/160 kD subunit